MMGWRAYISVPTLVVACWTEKASTAVAREATSRAAENFMVMSVQGAKDQGRSRKSGGRIFTCPRASPNSQQMTRRDVKSQTNKDMRPGYKEVGYINTVSTDQTSFLPYQHYLEDERLNR